MATLHLHTPSGIPVQVTLGETTDMGTVRLEVELPTKGIRARADVSRTQQAPPAMVKLGATHLIPVYGAEPMRLVGFAADQAAELDAAILACLEADPASRARRLVADRRRLQSEVTSALDAAAAQRERAFERDMGGIPSYESPRYLAARAALDEFDAAHPEVIAQIEADKDAEVARHMWD